MTLILQTLFLSVISYSIIKFNWISIIVILIIAGGLMVSFIYVCTLIPSEPTYFHLTWFYPLFILPFFILVLNNKSDLILRNNAISKPLTLFNYSAVYFTIIIILILLITLLVISSNTLQIKTPMRSFL